jgi:hypothetical protein
MSLSELVAGHSHVHEQPAAPSGLGSMVRQEVATAVELERPNLARMMNQLRPAPKLQSTNASSIADFDRKGMAERLATRRRALEATFMPDQRKWARLSGYEEFLRESGNGRRHIQSTSC